MSFTGLLGDWLRKINASITSLSINGPTVTYNKYDGTVGTETINLDSIYAKRSGDLVTEPITRVSPNGHKAQFIAQGGSNEIVDVGWNYQDRDGALLGLRSSSHTYPGYFYLTARDLTNAAELIGTPDGTLSWNGKSLINNGEFNQMFFSQTSGSYTAPYTGIYRITLKGGGGAGAFRNIGNTATGGGGGEGATAIFYATLAKNTVYAYTIGAGAQSGYAVDDGQGNISYIAPTDSGSTSIVINNFTFSVAGGKNAWTGAAVPQGGQGGYSFALPGVTAHRIYGCPGQNGFVVANTSINEVGGSGGGNGGARSYATGGDTINGQYGGGGAGMSYRNGQQSIDFYRGGNGGDGYILIEYAG